MGKKTMTATALGLAAAGGVSYGAVFLDWMSFDLRNENGAPLARGSIVQLLSAGANRIADCPWLTETEVGAGGDDVLLATIELEEDGWFYAWATRFETVAADDRRFVRPFRRSNGIFSGAYGDSALRTGFADADAWPPPPPDSIDATGLSTTFPVLLTPCSWGSETNFGCWVEVEHETPTAQLPLDVRFSGWTEEGCVGRSFNWDFGDGNRGEGQRVVHTYASTGHYNVRLTVQEVRCAECSAEVTVDVVAPQDCAWWLGLLGGSSVAGAETVKGLAVIQGPDVVMSGSTGSPAFPRPISSGCAPSDLSEAYVVRVNSDGESMWSRLLGGSHRDGARGQLAVDSAGRVIITGSTSSRDFPVTVGAFDETLNDTVGKDDGFVTQLSAAGDVVWSTYLGGWSRGEGVAVDGEDNVYVVGVTLSTDFAVQQAEEGQEHAGGYEAFLAKFNRGGELVWSRFIGGSKFEYGGACVFWRRATLWSAERRHRQTSRE